MLHAYCDCSTNGNITTAAAIVVTSKYFVDYLLKPLKGVSNSYQGELQAVIMVMELIHKNFDTPQTVKIMCDCAAVVAHFQFCLRTGWVPRNRPNYSDWRKLVELCKGHTVYIEHIHAHRDKKSYNMLCDVGARAVLKEACS